MSNGDGAGNRSLPATLGYFCAPIELYELLMAVCSEGRLSMTRIVHEIKARQRATCRDLSTTTMAVKQPSLPQSLLHQIRPSGSSIFRDRFEMTLSVPQDDRQSKPGLHYQTSRKNARKQQRQDLKHRKAQHNTSPRQHLVADLKRVSPGPSEATSVRKWVASPSEPSTEPPQKKVKFANAISETRNIDLRHDKLKKIKRVDRKSESVAALLPRTEQEQAEDAYIAQLEKRLGYKSGNRKNLSYEEEGDDLDGKHLWGSIPMKFTNVQIDLLNIASGIAPTTFNVRNYKTRILLILNYPLI